MDNKTKSVSFTSIELDAPCIEKNTAKTKVVLTDLKGHRSSMLLVNTYDHDLRTEYLPLLRLAFCMPLLNYGLFAKQINLRFPLCRADFDLLNDLNIVFSRDIFVNKIAHGNNPYILPKYFPNQDNITLKDGDPKATIIPTTIIDDETVSKKMDPKKCGVLSSGGKDSLLTYGLLKELGATTYPLYMNESGGHWRTAVPAYRYHQRTDPHTQKVWTNIDRFYVFMLDHLPFIRPDHRKIWADSYPIRLCIFPFYIFSLLPIFVEQQIGNLLLGSEFDDLRYELKFKGIKHYYGVYDQHQDYDVRMNAWYAIRIPGLYQWSALRNISGLVDQKILAQRYPELARHQRSCHSCHIKNGKIYPCGTCSKCLGIMLYLLANKIDPTIMNYRKKDIDYFYKHVSTASLKLDKDEKEQSFFLLKEKGVLPKVTCIDHVERIHIDPSTCNPEFYPRQYREPLLKILEQYTTGYSILKGERWVPVPSDEVSHQLSSLTIR